MRLERPASRTRRAAPRNPVRAPDPRLRGYQPAEPLAHASLLSVSKTPLMVHRFTVRQASPGAWARGSGLGTGGSGLGTGYRPSALSHLPCQRSRLAAASAIARLR